MYPKTAPWTRLYAWYGMQWMCFDACPVTACLPYTAKRMRALTPNAKLVFMVSSIQKQLLPASCCFSLALLLLHAITVWLPMPLDPAQLIT